MQDTPKSPKYKASLLELLAVVFTIIGTVAQVTELGFQIFDYFQSPQLTDVEVIQKEKNNCDKANPGEIHILQNNVSIGQS